MYNLTVDTAHTFYVRNNGWLAHNSPYFRGKSPTLIPKPGELKIKDGIVQPARGVPSNTDSSRLVELLGGAHPIEAIPEGLEIVRQGGDPGYYEIKPSKPMSESKFNKLLSEVKFGEAIIPCKQIMYL
ncbi:hypothetical protein [Deinococcus sp.]|uniref:hypothetical protein n=1 Tax=Deinococcus sp. TaxID=47478 RepID=UPI003CC60818